MDYDRKQYFTENADATVKGFTIIELGDDQYRIAEKWSRSDGSTWTTYWLPADRLTKRVASGKCEPVGQLSDEQFTQVCQLSDERALEENEKVPA